MIIETPKTSRDFILLRKGGDKLYKIKLKKEFKFPKIQVSYKNIIIKKNQINSNTNINNNNNISTLENKNNSDSKKIKSNLIKSKLLFYSTPKDENNKRKNIFIKKNLNDDKNFLIQDYIRSSELSKTSNKCIHRKIISNEIERNSYINNYVNILREKNRKFPLLKKDIHSNFILYENEKKNIYKKMNKTEIKIPDYRDLNEKLGTRFVNFKSENYFGKPKKNPFFQLGSSHCLKTFCSINDGVFSRKRKKLHLNLK